MDDKKPEWFNGTQKEWKLHIRSMKKSFIQRPFAYHSYLQDTEGLQKIKHFIKCVKRGELPDNKILLWMAESFERYIEKESTRLPKTPSSFEESFGMPPIPKAGSPVKRYNKAYDNHQLLNAMAEILVENEGIGQDEAAHQAIKKICGENYDESKIKDAASLARDFRGWPANQHTIELFKIRKRKKADK